VVCLSDGDADGPEIQDGDRAKYPALVAMLDFVYSKPPESPTLTYNGLFGSSDPATARIWRDL
jgi:hypothetical protein